MISLDPAAAAAPYEQIRSQVTARVERGDLAPGTRMPTVRALAEELGIAANTVARAYRELEADGVLDTRGRAGTFVAGDGVDAEARSAARAYAARVTALGLSPADALALVDEALRSRS